MSESASSDSNTIKSNKRNKWVKKYPLPYMTKEEYESFKRK